MRTSTKYIKCTFRKAVFWEKRQKTYYIGEFVLFSTILNRTIPGIVLSEIVLSGDPLYFFFSKIVTVQKQYAICTSLLSVIQSKKRSSQTQTCLWLFEFKIVFFGQLQFWHRRPQFFNSKPWTSGHSKFIGDSSTVDPPSD